MLRIYRFRNRITTYASSRGFHHLNGRTEKFGSWAKPRNICTLHKPKTNHTCPSALWLNGPELEIRSNEKRKNPVRRDGEVDGVEKQPVICIMCYYGRCAWLKAARHQATEQRMRRTENSQTRKWFLWTGTRRPRPPLWLSFLVRDASVDRNHIFVNFIFVVRQSFFVAHLLCRLAFHLPNLLSCAEQKPRGVCIWAGASTHYHSLR